MLRGMRTLGPGLVAVVAACSSSRTAPSPAPAPAPAPAEPAPPSFAQQVEPGLLPSVRVRGEDVRYSLAERMREHRIPGVSIAVFEKHKLVWAKAYGVADVDTGAPVTEATLFQAGSISKSVNALAALQAAADGAL